MCLIVDTASVCGGPVCDREPGETGGYTRRHADNRAGFVSIDRQQARAGAFDVEVRVDGQGAVCQQDRAFDIRCEVDDRSARFIHDRVAQRAFIRRIVTVVGDCEGAEQRALLERFEIEDAILWTSSNYWALRRRIDRIGNGQSEIREKLRSPSAKAPLPTSQRRGFRSKLLREDATVSGCEDYSYQFQQ